EEIKGCGLRLLDSIQNEGSVHHNLINKIEEITKRNLICYVCNFPHPAGSISAEDAGWIEMVLKSVDLSKYDKKLDLLIHSPGGDPNGAERIIHTCRSYATSFRVIVAKTAMSAATLIAMGADEVLMSLTSELGPIDPQMIIGQPPNQTVRPAIAFIEAYQDLINKAQEAIKKGEAPYPYLELLRRMDPSWIQICLKARQLSKTIAKEYLSRYMLKEKGAGEIDKVIENFMKTGEEALHGRIIRADKVEEYGLKVKIEDINSELWNLIWEAVLRCENYLQQRRLAKYIVARSGGINIQIQLRKLV
ncbi:MAG TPA: hypothetical protein ENI51_04870, partial [Candidatus Atribacteria bacterium]|nr:hypothetical protein [Candidatus Atribacteria bacterium]